jgi:hypothetical protein
MTEQLKKRHHPLLSNGTVITPLHHQASKQAIARQLINVQQWMN